MPVTADESVEVIFSEALEIGSEAQRATFVRDACGGDAVLRGRVDALLEAHTSAGSFLERPVLGGATVDLGSPPEGPGTVRQLGRFKSGPPAPGRSSGPWVVPNRPGSLAASTLPWVSVSSR